MAGFTKYSGCSPPPPPPTPQSLMVLNLVSVDVKQHWTCTVTQAENRNQARSPSRQRPIKTRTGTKEGRGHSRQQRQKRTHKRGRGCGGWRQATSQWRKYDDEISSHFFQSTTSVHTSCNPQDQFTLSFSPRHQLKLQSTTSVQLPPIYDISSHFLQSATSVYNSFSHDISSHFNSRLTTSLRTAPCCNTRLHAAMFHWTFFVSTPHVATTRLTGRVERQVPSTQRVGRGKNQSIGIDERSIFTFPPQSNRPKQPAHRRRVDGQR